MKLKRFLSKSRIIDIKSTDFKGAVAELIDTLSPALLEGVDKKKVLADVMERETAISTYLGNGICMPHTRVDGLKQKYVFSSKHLLFDCLSTAYHKRIEFTSGIDKIYRIG